MSTDLQTRPTVSMSLQLSNLGEIRDFCKVLANTDMVPKAYLQKPDNILVAILHGQEVGLPHLQALQSIAVVNGIPSIYGDAALAMVRASGKLEDFDEWIEVENVRQEGPFAILSLADEGKNIVAFCKSKRAGMSRERVTTFSVDDAKRAGLWGKSGPWTTVPQRMLMWRARGWNLRDNFGDVLKGLSLYEEAMDIDTAKGSDGAYRPAVSAEIVDSIKEAESLVDIQAKLKAQREQVQGDGLAASASTDHPIPVIQDAPAPKSVTPFPAGAIPQAAWEEAITQIRSMPDWNILVEDWKADRKCKNERRVIPAGQQNLLAYLREKIGPAFPY